MSVYPFKFLDTFLIFILKVAGNYVCFFNKKCYISPLHETSDRLYKSIEKKLKNIESPLIKKVVGYTTTKCKVWTFIGFWFKKKKAATKDILRTMGERWK